MQEIQTSSDARLARIAAGSLIVALVTMAIKYFAYQRTGSVALYSDALESIVNLVTAAAVLVAIRVSSRPADKRHPFGHHKAELFSAALEGALIIIAAMLILRESYGALFSPRDIDRPLEGLIINGVATTINAVWSYVLISRGKAWRSPALVADGWHLFTDVATSLGVILGVALVAISGWRLLDPAIAMAVAVYILVAGYRIISHSVSGLMDEAASADTQERIRSVIAANGDGALQVHDIRTRHAGRVTFIEFHLVVPSTMTVLESHQICDRLEHAIEADLDGAEVIIHVEPEHKAKVRGAVELSAK